MPDYGYRVSTFTAHGRSKSHQECLPLVGPSLHPSGAVGLIGDAAEAVQAAGPNRDRNGHHNEIVQIHRAPQYVLLIVKGGASGDDYMVTPASGGEDRLRVSTDDALTWFSRILYVFPAGEGVDHQGIHIMETRGASSHGNATNARINDWLTKNQNLTFDYRHDVADGYAWRELLEAEESRINAIEFQSSALDNTPFRDEVGVTAMKVRLELEPERPLKERLFGIFAPSTERRRPREVRDILHEIGGTRYDDALESGTAKAEVTIHGRKRIIRLNQPNRWFTRDLDAADQLDNHEFLRAVQSDILDLANAIGTALGPHPLPTEPIPQHIEPPTEI